MSDNIESDPSVVAEDRDEFDKPVAPGSTPDFSVPPLPEGSGLQPRLDSIFAEVQANLPSIDFDVFDVSSDEEMGIFSRSIKLPVFEKQQDDKEFSPETWKEALRPCSQNLPQPNRKSPPQNRESSLGDAISSEGSSTDVQLQDPFILQIRDNISMKNYLPDFTDKSVSSTCNELLSALHIRPPNMEQNVSSLSTDRSQSEYDKPLLMQEDANGNMMSSRTVNSNNSNLEWEDTFKEVLRNLGNQEMTMTDSLVDETPTLDIQRIEDIDLDLLLDAFPLPMSREGNREVESLPSSPTEDGNISLMDKLTQLCIDQSGGKVSSESLTKQTEQEARGKLSMTGGRVTHKTANIVWDEEEEDNIAGKSKLKGSHLKGTQTNTVSSVGVSTRSWMSLTKSSSTNNAIKLQKSRETVYLDLRGFGKEKEEKPVVSDAVRRICGMHLTGASDSSSSDSESEDDLQSWIDQRKNARAAAAGSQQNRNRTSENKVSAAKKDNNVVENKLSAAKKENNLVVKERKTKVCSVPQKMVTTMSPGSCTPTQPTLSLTSAPLLKPPTKSKTKTRDRGSTPQSEAKLMEQNRKCHLEVAKKLCEQREKEKASRLSLHEQLSGLRPKMSVSGKLHAAQATDVLFDYEASYGSAPLNLPPFLPPDYQCVLLTAHLSTSGELLLHHRGSGSRCVDKSSRLSATYPVLLTWLLSLVPKNFDFITSRNAERDEMLSMVPFLVVGMEQKWQGSEFVLNVAIVPSDIELLAPPLIKKSKVRSEVRDCTPFQQFVIKFLSCNKLHSVCPWVQDVFALVVSSDEQIMTTAQQRYRDGVLSDGSYIPPLPYISNKSISSFLTVNHDHKATRKVFDMATGFFWQTVDAEEAVCKNQCASKDYDSSTDIQNTMTLVFNSIYGNPHSMNGVLHRVIQEGLDISGFRLLYPTEDMSPLPPNLSCKSHRVVCVDGDCTKQDLKRINQIGPVLALGLRGAMARTRWLDAVGPSDPLLARRTDPKSLMALFGGASRDEATIYCPRQPSRVSHEMCTWFGGRVPPTGVIDIGISQVQAEHRARGYLSSPKTKRTKKGNRTAEACSDNTPVNLDAFRQPVSTLVATTNSDVFLTVAPIVPPMCVTTVLSTCQTRGFQLRGIRRVRLNHCKAMAIGLSFSQVCNFRPVSCTTPTSPHHQQGEQLKEKLEAGFANATYSPMPSLVILLRKENAMHQSASLIESLMVTLSMQGMLTTIADSCSSECLDSNQCFHVSSYSESLLASLGGDFSCVPEGKYAGLHFSGTFYSSPELEQIAVVTFSGTKAVKSAGNRLGKLLGLYPVTSQNQAPSSVAQGLELLGIKWLPSLTLAQAREITPYEVGDCDWQPSVRTLASNPTLLCVVRGIDAFQNVRNQLGLATQHNTILHKAKPSLEVLVAATCETAFRQATMFFRDTELFADQSMRVNIPCLPPLRYPTFEEMSITRFAWAEEGSLKGHGQKKKGHKGKQGKGVLVLEESILKSMLIGPRPLNTVLVIKPYAVRKHLSKLLKRTIQEGFTIVAMRLTMLTASDAKALLSNADQRNNFIQAMHTEHLTSGPVAILCLQRENAVKKLLDVLGPEDPQEARKCNQFFWRALYGADPINNGLHGSLTYSQAVDEQNLLFPDGVCCLETPDLKADKILCPALDSIIGNHMAAKRTFAMKAYPVRMDSNESLSPVVSNHSLHDNAMDTQSSGVSTSTFDLLLTQHSTLCQINCLLLTPPVQLLSVNGHKQGHVQVIDGLLSHGFEIVAMRMVWFQRHQAHEYLSLCNIQYTKWADILCHGPSIAIAVQRDNAVSCFETAIGSSYEEHSLMRRYGQHILRPKTSKEAAKHLEFFFDGLMPRSQGEILSKDCVGTETTKT